MTAVAVFCVVATAWPATAAPWPPADVTGVHSASPLLAPVDVELEPAPSAPVERSEITLALQPPRSWAGLLDLGISSGGSRSLSETRVWGFFLGSPDCVGLERLQAPDSTGDASFIGRSLRHGVYFARNNPVAFLDPNGRESVGVMQNVRARELTGDELALRPQEIRDGTIATAVVGSLLIPGPEDVVIAAAGTKLAARAAGKVGSFFRKLFGGGKKSIDDVLKNARLGGDTKGRSTLFEKDGGFDAANNEFDDLGLDNVREIEVQGGTGRAGELPDGRTVVVRSRSKGNSHPTLEIQDGKKRTKVRFIEPELE